MSGKSFKVHLDGYNLLPFLSGEQAEAPRQGFFYWSDDGDLMAVRVHEYKFTFMQQDAEIGPRLPLGLWQSKFTELRIPTVFDLRSDPFERATSSFYYADWLEHRAFLFVPAQTIVGKMLETFKDFPPRAKAASFTVSDAMEKIGTASQTQH